MVPMIDSTDPRQSITFAGLRNLWEGEAGPQETSYRWEFNANDECFLNGFRDGRRYSSNRFAKLLEGGVNLPIRNDGEKRADRPFDFAVIAPDGWVPPGPITKMYTERVVDPDGKILQINPNDFVPSNLRNVASVEDWRKIPKIWNLQAPPAAFVRGYLMKHQMFLGESIVLLGPRNWDLWTEAQRNLFNAAVRDWSTTDARIICAVDNDGVIIATATCPEWRRNGQEGWTSKVAAAAGGTASWAYKAAKRTYGFASSDVWNITADLVDRINLPIARDLANVAAGGLRVAGESIRFTVGSAEWFVKEGMSITEALGIPKEALILGAVALGAPFLAGAAFGGAAFGYAMPFAYAAAYGSGRSAFKGIASKAGVPASFVNSLVQTTDNITLNVATLGQGGNVEKLLQTAVQNSGVETVVRDQLAQLSTAGQQALARELGTTLEKLQGDLTDRARAVVKVYIDGIGDQLKQQTTRWLAAGPKAYFDSVSDLVLSGVGTYSAMHGLINAAREATADPDGAIRSYMKSKGLPPRVPGVTMDVAQVKDLKSTADRLDPLIGRYRPQWSPPQSPRLAGFSASNVYQYMTESARGSAYQFIDSGQAGALRAMQASIDAVMYYNAYMNEYRAAIASGNFTRLERAVQSGDLQIPGAPAVDPNAPMDVYLAPVVMQKSLVLPASTVFRPSAELEQRQQAAERYVAQSTQVSAPRRRASNKLILAAGVLTGIGTLTPGIVLAIRRRRGGSLRGLDESSWSDD